MGFEILFFDKVMGSVLERVCMSTVPPMFKKRSKITIRNRNYKVVKTDVEIQDSLVRHIITVR